MGNQKSSNQEIFNYETQKRTLDTEKLFVTGLERFEIYYSEKYNKVVY